MPPKDSVSRLHELVAFHQTLLADGVRNRAFHRALRARVRPSASVLDIGAGTGLWAIAAARLGARRVVAVEKERLLAPVIDRLARENGVRDRIEIVTGDSREVTLGERFDLIVSETVGNEAFDEKILPVLADARRRFLRKGGTVIPESVALAAAPAHASGLSGLAGDASIRARYFRSLAVHFPHGLGQRRLRRLAPPVVLIRVKLASAGAPSSIGELQGRWRVRELGRVNCLVLWADMRLAPGVFLSTLSRTHWVPTLLGVEPLGVGAGTLTLRLDLSRGDRRWDVIASARAGTRELRYSALFAYGAVRGGLTPLTVARGRG